MPLDSTIQLGEPVSHRGVVVAPLFPRLDAGRRLRDARRGAAARLPRHRGRRGRARAGARRRQSARPQRAALRRRGADRREAEPDPQRDRARRGRLEDDDPRLVRRGGTLERALGGLRRRVAHGPPGAAPAQGRAALGRPARARDRPARGLGGRARQRGAARRRTRRRWRRPTRTARARTTLAALRAAFPLQPGQCGALLAIGDALCLDYVSRPGAFARLYPKLLDGYLLDALGRLDGEPGDGLGEFLAAVEAAPRSHGPSAGLGEDVRLASETVLGSGLELDGELIQLCAFTREGAGRAPGSGARAQGGPETEAGARPRSMVLGDRSLWALEELCAIVIRRHVP